MANRCGPLADPPGHFSRRVGTEPDPMYLSPHSHYRFLFRGTGRKNGRNTRGSRRLLHTGARHYQFGPGGHRRPFGEYAGFRAAKPHCAPVGGGDPRCAGLQFLRVLGVAHPRGSYQSGRQEFRRVFRDSFHGVDPGHCGGPLPGSVYPGPSHLCGTERGPGIGVPLLLRVERRHGPSPGGSGGFFGGGG